VRVPTGSVLRVIRGLVAAIVVFSGAASAVLSSSSTSSVGSVPSSQTPGRHMPAPVFDLADRWRPPRDTPAVGRLLNVAIPGTVSRFDARTGLLYLPPAALVRHPPELPVVVMLSGQSPAAQPSDVEVRGHLSTMMDALAAAHHGLAPIVVVPDQLERGPNNPMCVDGPLGNSRTYLTVDVPNWIRAHLRVEPQGRAWTIAGFSQGGTCAIQLGAGFPSLFGNLLDLSGEAGPTLGDVRETVSVGFGGNRAAYLAAQPSAVLAAHATYGDSDAFFGAAQLDTRYGPAMPGVAADARRAGMHVTTWVVPNVGHNWAGASAQMAAAMRWLLPHVGLTDPWSGDSAHHPF
jgi:S-formylglutathione hydrolase FrmB